MKVTTITVTLDGPVDAGQEIKLAPKYIAGAHHKVTRHSKAH